MTKLEELTKQIDECKEAYYNGGKSPLSDEQYDRLVSKATALGYIDHVGSKPAKSIPTIRHEHPMLSLDKVHSVAEVKKFVTNKPVLYMYKADGLTCSATYKDGILVRLETRGDGTVGNDIMLHAKSIDNLPKTISKDNLYVIDGEVVILQKDFEEVNSKGEYSNPRNLAAGSLNQLDPAISKQRHLRFYAWDIIDGYSTDSLGQNLREAENLGFDIVGYMVGADVESNLIDLKNSAEKIGFPIDGVVIKYDSVEYGNSLGSTEHHKLNAIAYKFQDESYETHLDHVEFQVGKSGQITPVAVFDTVMIDNTEVERASLHNLSVMSGIGLTNNCTIYVAKKNQIIPQIVECDDDGDGPIEIPKICPICSAPTKVVKQNASEVLYCTNPHCKGKLLGLLTHFVSKAGLDIKGLSEQTLELLIKIGAVNNFSDILSLRNWRDKLVRLPGLGEKSVDKLLKSIDDACNNTDPAHFISALSIPGIGLAQAKIIIKKFKTIDEFVKSAPTYNFTYLEGFGDVLQNNIRSWFSDEANLRDLSILCDGIRFSGTESLDSNNNSIQSNGKLAGKAICVTGNVHIFKNRKELTDKAEACGAKVVGSVSKNTDYLINNDVTSSSSKNTKAKALNVPIITEEQFIEMIGE